MLRDFFKMGDFFNFYETNLLPLQFYFLLYSDFHFVGIINFFSANDFKNYLIFHIYVKLFHRKWRPICQLNIIKKQRKATKKDS